eukprot:TRINITY_DN6508_c1_g2_i1.p1 TRINITY_DN6508_c1_g2~~TRINITY_DN6508_c1_g2_i1.p1  ORF type:complete len:813 (+),score=73.11 TRINITY_DN6508_c1_g2_i1:76-2514(+)
MDKENADNVRQMLHEVTGVCEKLEKEGKYLESLDFHVRSLELCRKEYGEKSKAVEDRYLNIAALNYVIAQGHLDLGNKQNAASYLLALENLTSRPLVHTESNERRLLYRAKMFTLYSVLKQMMGKPLCGLRYAEKSAMLFLKLSVVEELPRCFLNLCALNSSLGLHRPALKYAYTALQHARQLQGTEGSLTSRQQKPDRITKTEVDGKVASSRPNSQQRQHGGSGMSLLLIGSDKIQTPVQPTDDIKKLADEATRAYKEAEGHDGGNDLSPLPPAASDDVKNLESVDTSANAWESVQTKHPSLSQYLQIVSSGTTPPDDSPTHSNPISTTVEKILENTELSQSEQLILGCAVSVPTTPMRKTQQEWREITKQRKIETVDARKEMCLKLAAERGGEYSQNATFAALRVQTWFRKHMVLHSTMVTMLTQHGKKSPRKAGTPPPPPARPQKLSNPTRAASVPSNISNMSSDQMTLETLVALSYHSIAVEQEHCKMYESHIASYQLAASKITEHLGYHHPLASKLRAASRKASHAQRERDTGSVPVGSAVSRKREERKGRQEAYIAASLFTRRQQTLSVFSGDGPTGDVMHKSPKRRVQRRQQPVTSSEAAASVLVGRPASLLRKKERPAWQDASSVPPPEMSSLRKKKQEQVRMCQGLDVSPLPFKHIDGVTPKKNSPLPRMRTAPSKHPPYPQQQIGIAPVTNWVQKAHDTAPKTSVTQEAQARQGNVVKAHNAWVKSALTDGPEAGPLLTPSDIAYLSSTFNLSLSTRPLGSQPPRARRTENVEPIDKSLAKMTHQREEASLWLQQLKQEAAV